MRKGYIKFLEEKPKEKIPYKGVSGNHETALIYVKRNGEWISIGRTPVFRDKDGNPYFN